MKVLIWQWYRRGGPPRFSALLTEAMRALPGIEPLLSLPNHVEALRAAMLTQSDLPVDMYDSVPTLLRRLVELPFAVGALTRRLAPLQLDFAVCAQPHMFDLVMAGALRRLNVPFVVLVHDADAHPGDGLPLQMILQRQLCARAAAVGALTAHVAASLERQGVVGPKGRPLLRLMHPPVTYELPKVETPAEPGLRLLCFGRLLPYKGLDMLAEALAQLSPPASMTVRVVGSGPETPTLDALRALPGVSVENRWVADDEIGGLLAWSTALVLPYREASQSGVAAAALAAGRRVLSTRVGGLVEQLSHEPRAIMCEPDPASLVSGLQTLLTLSAEPDAPPPSVDTKAAWREMAASMMQQVEALGVLPARTPQPAG
jgi:glycosyltransferase involved in cell wall biosynthesis